MNEAFDPVSVSSPLRTLFVWTIAFKQRTLLGTLPGFNKKGTMIEQDHGIYQACRQARNRPTDRPTNPNPTNQPTQLTNQPTDHASECWQRAGVLKEGYRAWTQQPGKIPDSIGGPVCPTLARLLSLISSFLFLT